MNVSVTPARQTFRKSERLCSRKILETLITKGRNIHATPFRLTWLVTPLTKEVPAQIAFAVPKRNLKNAVDRNRMKRLMRESFRKNKSGIYAFISDRGISVAMLLVFTGKETIGYPDTETKTKIIFTQLAQELKKFTG
jgi:ribonuclease P protein component